MSSDGFSSGRVLERLGAEHYCGALGLWGLKAWPCLEVFSVNVQWGRRSGGSTAQTRKEAA